MELQLTRNYLVMRAGTLDALEYTPAGRKEADGLGYIGMNMNDALAYLREHPRVALKLLSHDGPIIYMGMHADEPDGEGRTLGMRFKADGYTVVGDNVYGNFLSDLRAECRRMYSAESIEEEPVHSGQIVVDFTPEGDEMSDIEAREADGSDRYIHTEPYRPAKFRFNVAMDGTTGHAERANAPDVPFQTFECPFGLDYRSRIRVSSAAEASLLYEEGIRGDIDWKKLFSDLKRRGLLKNMSGSEEQTLMNDLRAQFDWMRERIATDGSLARKTVVAGSLLIPDASFGRTMYDPEFAPSPAHILARYINNPMLLYTASSNGVVSALENTEKNDAYRFSVAAGSGKVVIVVDGSDTIGGRVPKTRAVMENVPVYKKNDKGKTIYRNDKPVIDHFEKRPTMQFKSGVEVAVDYALFAERLETVVSNIAPDVKIEFVTGKGVGVPRLLERFVRRHKGADYDWDYEKKTKILTNIDENGRKMKESDFKKARYSVLTMADFNKVQPVLVGAMKWVEVSDDVEFSINDGVRPSAYLTFSHSDDNANRAVLQRGSLAANSGLSVVHVMDNRSEDDQILTLASEGALSRNAFIAEQTFDDTLFDGVESRQWDIDADSGVLSFVLREDNVAIPSVSVRYDAAVHVNGVPYHSVYAVYAALLLKECGVTDMDRFKDVSRKEDSFAGLSAIVAGAEGVSPGMQEKCLRNAVRLMGQASSVFVDTLLNTGDGDIVMPCLGVDGRTDTVLFTDIDGQGENRFGIVLKAERDNIRKEMEAAARKAEAEARKIAEKNALLQKRAGTRRAPGEKVRGGLPNSLEEGRDAIWFLGAHRPGPLTIPDGDLSFVEWEEQDYGRDALNRELASRSKIDGGDGALVDNKFVYLFPSDMAATMGGRRVMNNPNGRDLTGVRRTNPVTGEEFVCAFGIPVKKDNLFYELDNKYGRSCSFMLDRDSSALIDGIVNADAQARATAIQQNMGLCFGVRSRNLADGSENDDLSRVFSDKVWDYPRTREVVDRNTGKTVSEGGALIPNDIKKTRKYNREKQQYEIETKEGYKKEWVDNPHAAPRLRALMKRYEAMLQEGGSFPLNYICLPSMDYSGATEEKFLSDFSFALQIANAAAVACGRPMRFPLDRNGRLDLGPDVPDNLRDLAERKLDTFIGVVGKEDVINDALPFISRISIMDSIREDAPLKGDGSDLYVRPNDLMAAFGPYDYRAIINGSVAPIHEMAFTMDDGTLFRITDPRLSKNMSEGEINRYLRYEKNDECRFSVKSSNPERIPDFVVALKSYIERAKRVKVETRLLSDADIESGAPAPETMDGYLRVLSSNSGDIAVMPNEVGAGGDASALDLSSRFDGTDNDSVYYGKEDARDAFSGYVQFRYTLPDGSQSDWVTVRNKEIATDIVFTSINRVYRSDVRVLPSRNVLESEIRSLAIVDAGEKFRALSQQVKEVKVDTKVVDIERKQAAPEEVKAAPVTEKSSEKARGRVFVTYYGSRNVPKDAFKVQIATSCPPAMKEDMDVCFESLYPDYKTMVGPHKEGKIDDAEYARRYRDTVLEPNKEKILSGMKNVVEMAKEEGKDVYLYCYCKPGAFCHRYLVNNYLNENGIRCEENPADRQLYRQGRVALYGERPVESAARKEAEVKAAGSEAVRYTRSSGGYQQRTKENANADDVDFTVSMATDFTTYGEIATAKAAGSSNIPVAIPLEEGRFVLSQKAVREAAQQVLNALPEDFVNGEPFGVNLAGNGIYTLAKNGIDQKTLDVFVTAVFEELKKKGVVVRSIRSGGQTGIDETAAAVGNALSIPTVIHAPSNWAFRGTNGVDVKDETAFRSRFEEKDYTAIKTEAEKLVTMKKTVRKQNGKKI